MGNRKRHRLPYGRGSVTPSYRTVAIHCMMALRSHRRATARWPFLYMLPNKVAVFDTTLRDGEQAAGTRLGSREKVTLARQLARLNVDIIEAGYPNSSPEDFEAVRQIAEEMGVTLCRTGFSPNIKERLDYSCAIYDADGETIAQGDHLPVHLGAMPLSVRAAIDHQVHAGFGIKRR